MYLFIICIIYINTIYFMLTIIKKNINEIFNGNPKDALLSFCSHDTYRCKPPAGLRSCCVDHLAQMLDDLTHALGQISLYSGTLLAFKRYNGKHMIPMIRFRYWVLADHENLLKTAIPQLEKLGYVIEIYDVAARVGQNQVVVISQNVQI